MSVYYSKNKISQKKIQKIIHNQEEYVNYETWEVLDILDEWLNDCKIIKLTYKFIMINKELKHIMIIDMIGITYYWYLCLLLSKVSSCNIVDFSLLPLWVSGLNKFKWVMKKYGIIKYGKIGNMKTGRYFLNPLISSYGWKVSLELIKMFEKENKEIYWFTKL